MTLHLGLADPAHDSQRLFRGLLEAFAHPGRRISLRQPPPALPALSVAASAVLLTLIDRDTPLWLAPELADPDLVASLRFHTGAPLVAARTAAAFAVLPGGVEPLLAGFATGDDRYPDRSATLVVEVADLRSGPSTRWRGPGIEAAVEGRIAGLAEGFWPAWAANRLLFPCGVDVLFTAGSDLVALPRSVDVES